MSYIIRYKLKFYLLLRPKLKGKQKYARKLSYRRKPCKG